MTLSIKQVLGHEDPLIQQMASWYHDWLGKDQGESMETTLEIFSHSCQDQGLPQSFLALDQDLPIGMAQLAMMDDLVTRPHYYPWIINAFVQEEHRGKGALRELVATICNQARNLGFRKIYLYSKQAGLYEKLGWTLLEVLDHDGQQQGPLYLYTISLES